MKPRFILTGERIKFSGYCEGVRKRAGTNVESQLFYVVRMPDGSNTAFVLERVNANQINS